MIINNTVAGYCARGDNNNTLGLALCSTLSAGMIISFAIDVAGTIDNCTAYILFRPQNKKIVNNIVDIGTSLALLSDTDIITPQNNQVL